MQQLFSPQVPSFALSTTQSIFQQIFISFHNPDSPPQHQQVLTALQSSYQSYQTWVKTHLTKLNSNQQDHYNQQSFNPSLQIYQQSHQMITSSFLIHHQQLPSFQYSFLSYHYIHLHLLLVHLLHLNLSRLLLNGLVSLLFRIILLLSILYLFLFSCLLYQTLHIS